jgi:hypothetical protein
MKLGQSQGQKLQWKRCQIDIKGAPTRKSHSQATVHIHCSSHGMVQVPSSDGSPPPPPQSPPTPSPEKIEKLASPHPQETPNIPSPPPCPPLAPSTHETTKPTPPNGSAQNNHAKAGTSGPNTSVIGPGETPLPVNQSDVLAGANKSVDDTSKKVVGTTGPNTSLIAPGEMPLGKKALEKPSTISNQQ